MNKKANWREIEKALKATPRAAPPPSDVFWEDFRARAKLHPQHEVTALPSRQRILWPSLGVAAAALLMVALLVFPSPPRPSGHSEINSVEVIASHGGVLIMEDAPSESTILWIVDMELEGAKGENHS